MHRKTTAHTHIHTHVYPFHTGLAKLEDVHEVMLEVAHVHVEGEGGGNRPAHIVDLIGLIGLTHKATVPIRLKHTHTDTDTDTDTDTCKYSAPYP
jgi:hypothetical protein